MRRLTAFAAALVMAIVAVGMIVGSSTAQTAAEPAGGLYEACGRDEARIRAAALPRVVDQERCPVAGRQIVDRGVAVVVPEPGESVFAEATSPRGNEQLVVANPVGGALIVEDAGDGADPRTGAGPSPLAPRASGPSACADSYRNQWSSRLNNFIRWYFNRGSSPSYLSDKGAVRAVQRAGVNVSAVRDGCGVGDGVPAVLRYEGPTGTSVNMSSGGTTCGANDHKSVVGFGNLPSAYTGKTCIWAWIQDGPDRINSSDVRLNKSDYAWTTRVTSRCRGRYDVESTMTHERGHTFGLGDVSEASHGNLTMSDRANGPCQTSERSLGRGDAIGLNEKY